ncbi:chain-length determining protein [Altericroceibacterium spongiae]|uniref:Chain-length determining protein n=1 Tax=Altericroceibacterium spongiae TaxID=2320269 RepID=A0A420ERD1_9SPHN|nr:XrtA system polysaccharide chain length determinant [Altericroceibacterium spongiae]RKF23239.1 chain-length determining protein [Altericroceibacterium spongiae]
MSLNALLEEMRAALWTVWNRRWIALAVAWGICLLGWLAVALVPNSYQSNARIFIQLDDVLAQQIGIGSGSRQKDIQRIRQTLTSAVNLEKVVRSTRIGDTVTSPVQMETAVNVLAKEIQVSSQGDNLFEITATSGRGDLSDSENAQLAQEIVQRMIDIFREENLGGSRGEMRETLSFLDQQLAEREKQLADAEQRRLQFEAENPELIGGAQAIATKLSSSRAELRSVEADLAAARTALAAIDGQLADTPRILTGQGGTGPAAALAQAQASLAGMQARGLTDEHPDVIAVKRQIAALQQQVNNMGGAATGGTPNPAYSSLQAIRVERQANVQALQSRASALRSEIASISTDQVNEPGAAAEAQRISRDYDVLRKQYDKLLQDREELRLRGQVENERSAIKFEVIDPPSSPRTPSAPHRPLLLAGVLIVGMGAGCAVAFALGQINGSFATAAKLERNIGLQVIGTISNVLTDAAKERRAKQLRLFAGASAALGGLFVILLAVEFFQRGMVA